MLSAYDKSDEQWLIRYANPYPTSMCMNQVCKDKMYCNALNSILFAHILIYIYVLNYFLMCLVK